MNSSCQSDCAGSLSSGVDTSMEYLLHILEELGLSSTGVSQQEHVDITSDPMFAIDILRLSTKHC